MSTVLDRVAGVAFVLAIVAVFAFVMTGVALAAGLL